MSAVKTRVLVVEDSLTARRHIVDVLEADPAFEVVGEATDGRRATELCERLRPDIVTMDMVLPVMSGLAATEWIMAHCPTPIVVVSTATRGEVLNAYDAIAAGAVDVLEKRAPHVDAGVWANQLKSVLRVAARVKVVTHPRGRLAPMTTLAGRGEVVSPPPSSSVRVVAIGASTGGPGAVRELLLGLPAGFPVPILLVLHIGEHFDEALADWLDAQTPHRVSFGVDGESLFSQAPRVVMSPAGKHMSLRQGKIRFDAGPERHSCRPSVDVLFESVASDVGGAAAGVLLTGMGRDGAEGLLAIRRAGGRTFAQDEATSVIYGMPRVAVELGAVGNVLPLDAIAPALCRLTGSEKR
ncbi:MAG TPA: chemotaxis-specific protein-glutamate methyltransferase CheB [Labilithrix sp.]|nr:chemotaxis-specific protein-glutamate methyltransferase CheB [Labilithrix sp.]